jgi:hypothetical protein
MSGCLSPSRLSGFSKLADGFRGLRPDEDVLVPENMTVFVTGSDKSGCDTDPVSESALTDAMLIDSR